MTPISQETISDVVDAFYNKIQQHPELSEPFGIIDDWPKHKIILTHFWWMMLGGERYIDYDYRVAPKHRNIGFTPELLHRHWLPLFEETVREHVTPEQAEVWLAQAHKIGKSLHMMHDFWAEQDSQQ